jgi:hypothetical protein
VFGCWEHAIDNGEVLKLEHAAALVRERMPNTSVYVLGDINERGTGHAAKHAIAKGNTGIGAVMHMSYPSPGLIAGKISLGQGEWVVWKVWVDVEWCSRCTRAHEERTLVPPHPRGEQCPSANRTVAYFKDPFLSAFEAVKKFHDRGGLPAMHADDPDIDLSQAMKFLKRVDGEDGDASPARGDGDGSSASGDGDVPSASQSESEQSSGTSTDEDEVPLWCEGLVCA